MLYSNLLKNPQWQRKRLEVFQRDKFTCQCCGAKDKEIHLHHLLYKKGSLPHDYDNEMLVTLCCDCHDFAHKDLRKITALIAFEVLKKGVDLITLQQKIQLL
jgi:5-methylcytosine-specific restriction endonuclease McrA